jgi:hypothetical protein
MEFNHNFSDKRTLNYITPSAGETYQVPAETPFAGGKASDKKFKVASTYVVEKGKPLASPA